MEIKIIYLLSMPSLINKREWRHLESLPIPPNEKVHFSCGPVYMEKRGRQDKDTYSVRKRFKRATACGSPPERKKFHPGTWGRTPDDDLYHYGSEVGPRLNGLPMGFVDSHTNSRLISC